MTDTIYARLVTLETRDLAKVEFDVFDTKGRRFGASTRVSLVEFVQIERAEMSCRYIVKPADLGRWFFVRPHALRDGQLFGALPNSVRFRTEAEVDAYIAKYLADAEKRAPKNKARVK